MKLEQPKGLNRLRVPPLSWAAHWRLFKSLILLMLLTSMLMIEGNILSWLNGSFPDLPTLRMVGVGIAPFVGFFVILVIAP